MLNESAVFLRDELRRYFRQVRRDPSGPGEPVGKEVVLLGNIASSENNPVLADSVVITLVNIEEESALKNGKHWSRNPLTGGIETVSPPVYLNLYLLFTATLPDNPAEDGQYQKALERIAAVIEFFQAKKVFTLQNSPGFEIGGTLDEKLLNEIRLIPELYTLTFEQINHLWGSLGGKQSPFVMYKIRVLKIQSAITTEVAPVEIVNTDISSEAE